MNDQIELFPAEPKERIVIGGIYIPKGCKVGDPDVEFNISFGKALHLLYDGMSDIDNDVEIGGFHNYQLVDNYNMSIDKVHKKWKIKDTGFKQCKDVIATGSYVDGFEESMRPYLRIFHK